MKIGIVGLGHVGNSILALFKDAIAYDKYKGIGSKEEINKCDIVFICVPTPTNKKGCDTSQVEDVISWCEAKYLIIRSTVYIGFSDDMIEKYHKNIIFQPEYYGEPKNHPYKDETKIPWVTMGGNSQSINEIKSIYENKNIKVNICTTKEAEMAKYMCNSFLALKVTFANEMYELATKLGISYDKVKELFLEDPRIGKSHLDVYKDNRGFGGSCFPKDTEALLKQFKSLKAEHSLLEATIKTNKKFRKLNRNK